MAYQISKINQEKRSTPIKAHKPHSWKRKRKKNKKRKRKDQHLQKIHRRIEKDKQPHLDSCHNINQRSHRPKILKTL